MAVGELGDQVVHLLLRERPVDEHVLDRLAVTAERLGERTLDRLVEDHAAGRGHDQLTVVAVLDRLLELDLLRLDRQHDLVLAAEPLRPVGRLQLRHVELRDVLAVGLLGVGEEVAAEDHVLGRRRQRPAVRRREDVVRGQHQDPRLGLRLRRQRQVDRHLVAVEVGVERVADERVDLDRLALDEHRLERLDAEAVERRCAVQEHRVLGDDLLEDVPDLGRHRVDVLLRRLDVLDGLPLDEPAHDERLEELERHQLRQPALVQLQVRPGDDHRAARVVDALAEQVLAEPALLALEHVGQRLQRPVARAGDRAPAAAVVEQRVDGLLEHALLVVDDDLGRAEVEQPLEAVVPVDHAPVEVVQVAGGEAATVELDHRAQLRRDHRHGVEDHPLRLVLGLDERVDDLQPLDRAGLLLALRGADRLAERRRLGVEVEALEQLADRLRAHAAAEVDAEAVRRPEPVLQLAEDLLVVDDHLRLEVLEELPGRLEPADGLDRRLAGVVAPRLDVQVHLAHLLQPVDDGVEVFLRDLPVGLQAEVADELAELLVVLAAGICSTDSRRRPLPSSRAFSRFFTSTPATSAASSSERSAPSSSRPSTMRLTCFVTAPFFDPVAFASSLVSGCERVADLDRGGRDRLELARGEPAVVADRRRADELADLLRVLGRDLRGDLDEQAADEPANVLEGRQQLLLGPVVQAADPEVVVLVEVLLLALREVVAAPLEAVLERGELLVAVDVDPLAPRP